MATFASSSSWPPASGLTTPTVPRQDAKMTSYATAHVKAPARTVFDAVCATDDYGQWNTWIPRVTIHEQPDSAKDSQRLETGTFFTYHVIMDPNKPTKETDTSLRVTDISIPDAPSDYVPTATLEEDETYTADLTSIYRISWKGEGGFASRGLSCERFHEIIVLGDEECEVRTWENQGGLLAHTVRWFYKKTLMEKFQLWCDDLKRYCEKVHQDQKKKPDGGREAPEKEGDKHE